MAEICIKIPEELEESMQEFKLDWKDIALKAMFERAEKLKKLKIFSSKIKVSDKDAKEFTDKISELVEKRFSEGE